MTTIRVFLPSLVGACIATGFVAQTRIGPRVQITLTEDAPPIARECMNEIRMAVEAAAQSYFDNSRYSIIQDMDSGVETRFYSAADAANLPPV